MKLQNFSVVMLLVLAACASSSAPAGPGTPPPAPAPLQQSLPDPGTPAGNPANYFGDADLYEILARPLDLPTRVALDTYEFRVGGIYMDRIGEVAEDSSASVVARVNALTIIGERRTMRQFEPVKTALLYARDPRVRATALNTADQLRLAGSIDAEAIMRAALFDKVPEIQAKAMQFTSDKDIAVLRRIVAAPTTNREVAAVANSVIQAAEERGAPLVADSLTGVLTRMSSAGPGVRFVPVSRWPEWQAAAGRVTLRTVNGRTVELPGLIEVVANVVPVFFSPDGRYVVYEADRHIRVRDLTAGTDRDLGPGIAPRVRPVSDEFLFVREDPSARGNMPDRTKLKYDVYTAPFAAAPAGEPKLLGSAGSFARPNTHGNYAPVRWMRVEDRGGSFFLTGETLEEFALPNPFANGTGR
ncbi:MAG: hypothetical protein ABIS27_01400 [Longimicrobiales bacterium]